MKKSEIKKAYFEILVKEIYGKYKLDQTITKEDLESIREFDKEVPVIDSLRVRVDSLREVNVQMQEKRFDEEIQDMLKKLDDEEAAKELIAKEYAELERLMSINREKGQDVVSSVEIVKKEEDGHSKMPIQALEILEEDSHEEQQEQRD